MSETQSYKSETTTVDDEVEIFGSKQTKLIPVEQLDKYCRETIGTSPKYTETNQFATDGTEIHMACVQYPDDATIYGTGSALDPNESKQLAAKDAIQALQSKLTDEYGPDDIHKISQDKHTGEEEDKDKSPPENTCKKETTIKEKAPKDPKTNDTSTNKDVGMDLE